MAMSPDPVRGNTIAVSGGRSSALPGNGLAVASMLTWAAGFPAAEVLLQSWPPVALFAARLLMAVGVMVPIWILIDGPSRVFRARWGHALFVGGVLGAGMFLLIVAQKLTDPVTVALIASCAPLFATLIELATGTRRLRWRFSVAVIISIIGGLIATNAVAPAQLGLGATCAILATGLFCWACMATARDFPDLSQTGRSTITFTGALATALVLYTLAGQVGMQVMPTTPFDASQAGMLAIYALVSMGLSQVFFVGAIDRLGVALASFHVNIAPFYVMLIMLMLGDDWNWTRALGAGIVALAVVLAQDRKVARPA